MKKIFCLMVGLLALGMASGQQVVNGVLHGSPSNFMFLTPQTGGNSTSWNDSWVKPSYDPSDIVNFTAQMGVSGGTYPSHRFKIYDPNNSQSLNNDNCFRQCSGVSFNRPIMAESWNSDLYPGTYVDTVIQMGMPGLSSANPSGKHAQQMLYSFIPDTNNPVLLLNFAFVTEDAAHTYTVNPGVEFAVLQHGTNNFLSLGNYNNNTNFPYSRFWYRTPSSNGTADPQNTPVARPTQSCPVQSGCPCQSGVNAIFTYPYTIVAFDLSQQARTNTAVDLRIRVWGCDYDFHWSYCYFTAKMIPAKLQVKYCGGDSLLLSVPWGFDETNPNSYQWFTGTDSAHATQRIDPDDPSATGVFQGSTKYNPIMQPNPAKPYYKCTVVSYTGIPFT